MISRKQTAFHIPALFAAAAACSLATCLAQTAPDTRTTMPAIRVPDGSIKVDGRLDDWPEASFSAPYERVADNPDHSSSILTQATRGPWTGPDDLSAKVRAAVDSNTLYVSGTIRDQYLFNEGDADQPWVGDDFEVFIDANPPETRFLDGTNENFAQFIFVPEHLWANTRGTFIWRAAKFPGVVAASRLTPLGYTIEVAIPMDVVPYWKAHHDQSSIGFDVQIGDLDTPGVIGHDPGPKIAMLLLQPYPQFKSAAHLSTLAFDAAVTKSNARKETVDRSIPGYDTAQKLLDRFDDGGIERQANAALKHPDLARKAALFILSKRSDLKANTDAIAAVLQEPDDRSPDGRALDSRVYAVMALADRHKLPAVETLTRFGSSDDLVLRNTALWALGVNGDRLAVPGLLKLYPEARDHTQEIIAVSLARLGDQTAVPSLEAYATRDHGQPFGILCEQLLKQLGIDYTPKAP